MRISDWSSDVCYSDLFLPQIEQDAPAAVLDFGDRRAQLRAAIAFEAAEHVTRQTFAVKPRQRRAALGRADQPRELLGRHLGGAKRHELRRFGAPDGHVPARPDPQPTSYKGRGWRECLR